MVFDPVHYLPLLEQKVGALDQAAPLAAWDLPEEFATLRRLMEARMIKAGRREYVQVLRLLETFEMADLQVAVKNALRMGAIGFDAVKHLVLCQVEKRPPKLDVPDEAGAGSMSGAHQILLNHRLKSLRLPTVLREYSKLAKQAAAEGLDHVQFLARLIELEMIDRERRIKAAKFPAVKSLDSFDFKAIPALNKMQVLELARCEWIERRENVIALGPSGTGKTHVALGLGLSACQKGLSVGFVTAAALVHELMEARDERRLLRLQKQMVSHKLLIIDELGFVPLSKTGAELLFELISQRYERGSTLITSNLPFDEWTETFGSERLTGALLDRLTHHVNILEMNGESYRLGQSKARQDKA
jgi:DNA replication protein DnaC